MGDITCPQENDLVLQCQVREVGDSLGPLDEREELLVSRMAYVGDRVICLIKSNTKRKTVEKNRRICQCKIFDNHCLHRTQYRIKLTILRATSKMIKLPIISAVHCWEEKVFITTIPSTTSQIRWLLDFSVCLLFFAKQVLHGRLRSCSPGHI